MFNLFVFVQEEIDAYDVHMKLRIEKCIIR